MKKAILIFTALALTLALTACGDDSSSKSSKKKNTKAESSSVSASATEKTDIRLNDVTSWATGKIWNDGFCDIYHYVESGTNSVGEQMDIDFTVSNLKIAMEKKDEYNAFIHTLDDSVPEQAQLINAWDKMMEQTDILYTKAITDTPRPSDETYEFNTDLFKQYFDTFYEVAMELDKPKFK